MKADKFIGSAVRVALVVFVLLGLGALVYTYADMYYQTWLACPDGVVVRDAAGLPACARGAAVGVGR